MVADSDRRAGLAPASRILITLAAAGVIFITLAQIQDLIAPLAIAALVVMVSHPVRRPLERRGWSPALATAAVIVVAYLILFVLCALLAIAAAEFVQLVPQYSSEIEVVKNQVVASLEALGFTQDSANQAAGSINPGTLLGLAAGLSSAVLGFSTAFFFVLAYIIFMAADASLFGRIFQRFADTKAGTIAVLTRYASSVRRYLAVNTVFGGIVAILDGIVLVVLGLPAPLLWVILAFVTNYIPNIGFVIALIPPALLALLTGGWGLALAVIAAYCLINATMQSLIQPKFVSDAVRLSLTLTFFSVVFWATVLGPVGAILAIPATLFLRALLLEFDRDAQWARWISGDRSDEDAEPATPPSPPAPSTPDVETADPAPAATAEVPPATPPRDEPTSS